jgi:hypothetical protein
MCVNGKGRDNSLRQYEVNMYLNFLGALSTCNVQFLSRLMCGTDGQNMTGRISDWFNWAGRTGTGRTGQADQNRQNRTSRTL